MRLRPCRRRRPWWPALLAAATALLTATVLLTLEPQPATAVVTHDLGYRATVLGFSSWYGSYGMGSLGRGWCIDHGSHSPDPDFGYARTTLTGVSPSTRTELAWVAARWGATTDRDTAAGVMLVLHDLMGAGYPYGRLVVETLTPTQLAGFGGHEGAVIHRARDIKADAVAHAGWRGPIRLTSSIDGTTAPVLHLALREAGGHGVAGVTVQLHGPVTWHLPATITTSADGTASWRLPAAVTGAVDLRAVVPGLLPDVWRSTTRRAQRIIRPTHLPVSARAVLAAPPPTTSTTSTSTTTSTTIPPTTTTTTTVPTTTTVAPAVVAPTTTTSPSTTSTSTTLAPTTTTAPPTPPAAATLPRTGTEPLGLAMGGLGLALLGVALVDLSPRSVDQDGPRGAAGRRA